MLDYIRLGGVTIHDPSAISKRLVNQGNLEGLAAPRQVTRPRPDASGIIDTTRHHEGYLVNLEGECSGADAEDALGEWDTVKAALRDTLPSGSLLTWQRGNGLELQRSVKIAALADPLLAGVGTQLNYQAQLLSPDPNEYSQTQQTATGEMLTDASGGMTMPFTFPITFTPSGAGECVVTTGGEAPTPAIFRIFGFCTSPRIVLTGSTKEIVLSGEIAEGDYLELDVVARTVKLNGIIDRPNLLVSEDTDWTAGILDPSATSTFRLVASNFTATARLDVLFRDAY